VLTILSTRVQTPDEATRN